MPLSIKITANSVEVGTYNAQEEMAPLIIGRDAEVADLVCPDPQVSRIHCLLLVKNEHWLLQDLNSVNGTCHNGTKIFREIIKNQDQISIGNTTLVFTLEKTCCYCHQQFHPQKDVSEPNQHLADYLCRKCRQELPGISNQNRISGYILVKEIGRGTQSTIYLAIDTEHKQAVAIKQTNVSGSPDITRRSKDEAMFMGQKLRSPNIVQVYHWLQPDNYCYAIMEYVEGCNVQELLDSQGAFPIKDALEIALEVGKAAEYIHNKGLVHRDIKPANIMITRKRKVKLTDFGVAKDIQKLGMTQSKQALGTFVYAAPEQLANAKHVDARADIYALGSTLFHMLTGSCAFSDKSQKPWPLTKFYQLVIGSPVPDIRDYISVKSDGAMNKILKAIALVIKKAMSVRPVNRYDTVREMMTAIACELISIQYSDKLNDNSITI